MSMPVFSYAQAAKGLGQSSQTASNVTSSASSEHGIKDANQPDLSTSQSKGKPSVNKPDGEVGTSVTTGVDSPQEAVFTPSLNTSSVATPSVNAPLDNTSSPMTSSKNKLEGTSTAAEESVSRQSSPHSRKVSSPDLQAISASQPTTELSTDAMTPTIEANMQAKSSDDQNIGESGWQTSETEKSKASDEDWDKVSIPSVAAEKELKAAPIPVVNVWQQRKDAQAAAQAAKLKETTPQRPSPSQSFNPQSFTPQNFPPKAKSSASGPDDNRRKASNKDQMTTETNTAAPRRVNSGNRSNRDQNSSQTSPRIVSQREDKFSSSVPPSVGDVEIWPTPDTAQLDERRRSTVTEKIEKTETNEQKSSGQKNKWTPIPFVPSVKFETQLPPAAQSRRGGRAANRGRGNGLAGQANKPEAGSMGPPPIPKQSNEQDRGRKPAAARSNRASSVPTDGSRPNNDSISTRKFSVTPAKDQGSTAVNRYMSNPSTPIEGGRTFENVNAGRASRSPSRKANRNQAIQARTDHNAGADFEAAVDASVSPSEPLETDAFTQSLNEYIKGQNEQIFRSGSEATRERGHNHNRDWTKDRPSSTREKSDNWRERREPRTDRGRGGFRGNSNRGGYSNTINTSYSYTAPLPQNGFEAPRNASATEARSRQSSQPFGPSPSFGSNRNNTRSQSIPQTANSNGFYEPMQAYPVPTTPITPDMMYESYGQMQPGILASMPYHQQLRTFAVTSMVSAQIEYYFCVNNLCKDMFLRKHMDSQGYVTLRFISSFKRMKEMLDDGCISFAQLRNICEQKDSIKTVIATDGEIHLRNRKDWEKFVLPMEERFPSAQHDGPIAADTPQLMHLAMTHPDFAPNNMQTSFHQQMNGSPENPGQYVPPMSFVPMAAHENHVGGQYMMHTESSTMANERRSSTTSPLSKIQSPTHELTHVLSAGVANGHHPSMSMTSDKESTFPDESVAVLKVVVRDPDYQGELSSDANDDHSFARVSGIRGGASSPAQMERIRSLQFGQNIPQSRNLSDQTVYWTQGEGSIRPGYVHEEYLILRDKAQSQRAEKHFDGALLVLYPLWADFLPLPQQFNVSMYEDFKTWALEDFENGNDNGKKHLVRFYEAMLASKMPMTERVATDIVNIARSESGHNRDLWHKLRTAWRNGATNFKTRKRLTDLLSSEEQTELDKGA